MSYCRKCGAALEKGAEYCSSCGTPVRAYEAEVRKRRSSGARILLLVFGGILLLLALPLLVGGGGLFALNAAFADSEGFIATKSRQLERDSYAVVFQHIDINLGEVAGEWGVWRPSPGDYVTIKITGSSNDPSKNVFIGIAEASDVETYLTDVRYHEITSFSLSPSGSFDVEYETHSGDTAPSDPSSQVFWTASEHGAGTQTLMWSPETGSYWIVLMNEDGSTGVDLTVSLGAKVPLIFTIGVVLLGGGVVALVIGVALIYAGAR